ncbi:FecR family protein [Bacteroides acidifaciens]|uniref:FecR family protein n=1 Tax=Bacteroides acidifaciens TaxID=85831 RepID=UPI0025A9A585|nr:FecR family protein [Bacteroides acidifaciens]
MKNRIRKFKDGKICSDELIRFKKEIDLMTDEELDKCLNNCESNLIFTNSDIDAMQDRLNEEIKTEKRQIVLHRFFKACVAVMLPAILLSSFWAFNFYRDLKQYESIIYRNITIGTDNGETSMTILPDGSKIIMGPQSTLSYNIGTFNLENREIKYDGEGYFSIKKNTEAPFKLKVSDLEIKVLGTRFSLYAREDKNSTEVYLEEGSLQLTSFISDSKKLLCPGETAVIHNETGEIEIVDDTSDYRRTAGQSIIYFKSSSLSNVAKDLELYYGKDVIVGKDIEHIQFTGSLPTNNLQQVIFVLENTLNISISINEAENILTFK